VGDVALDEDAGDLIAKRNQRIEAGLLPPLPNPQFGDALIPQHFSNPRRPPVDVRLTVETVPPVLSHRRRTGRPPRTARAARGPAAAAGPSRRRSRHRCPPPAPRPCTASRRRRPP